jgi:hypothetical protein
MVYDQTTPAAHLGDGVKRRLAALLDTIVPPGDDGAMPGAGELDFPGYLKAEAPDFLAMLNHILDHFDDDFPDLPLAERVIRVQAFSRIDAAAFNALVFRVYDCYYQDDRVRRLIGARPGPPFPHGHTIPEGDLSSLEAVKARGKGYRR